MGFCRQQLWGPLVTSGPEEPWQSYVWFTECVYGLIHVCVTICSSSCFSSFWVFFPARVICTRTKLLYLGIGTARCLMICVCVEESCGVFLTVVKSMLMKHFSWGAGRAESFKQWIETERHTYILPALQKLRRSDADRNQPHIGNAIICAVLWSIMFLDSSHCMNSYALYQYVINWPNSRSHEKNTAILRGDDLV